MSEHINNLKEEEKESAPMPRGKQTWIAGLALITLGAIFLANNFFALPFLGNWWALFILIPAAANLNSAWEQYRTAGRWTSGARGSLVSATLIGAVAFFFLFDLDWGRFWPLLLIILGVGILFRNQ